MGYLSHMNQQVGSKQGNREAKGHGDISVTIIQKSDLRNGKKSFPLKQENISFTETDMPVREYENKRKEGTPLTHLSCVVLWKVTRGRQVRILPASGCKKPAELGTAISKTRQMYRAKAV